MKEIISQDQILDEAEIGIFGGSGFYEFVEDLQERTVETPYGNPSDTLFLGRVGDRKVAFLPRHGRDHSLPAHAINYRANIWAMKHLGVQRLISPCAVGSLQADIRPGNFMILDQYIDRTKARLDTFYDGPIATHVSAADPYSEDLRGIAIKTAKNIGVSIYEKGTVVVIQGPRFSTKAESTIYTAMGGHVINMTQYPEVHLARELEMETLGIALITDFDCGLVGEAEPVTHEEVIQVMQQNTAELRRYLLELVGRLPESPSVWQDKVIPSARFL
jgi:5'-methylthioadenosine phosphorylase